MLAAARVKYGNTAIPDDPIKGSIGIVIFLYRIATCFVGALLQMTELQFLKKRNQEGQEYNAYR